MAEEHTPNRFRISWDGGAYYVSIPNYRGGWVVQASVADDLVKALEPFANGIITPDGTIIGLMREDVARARDVLSRVKGAPDHG